MLKITKGGAQVNWLYATIIHPHTRRKIRIIHKTHQTSVRTTVYYDRRMLLRGIRYCIGRRKYTALEPQCVAILDQILHNCTNGTYLSRKEFLYRYSNDLCPENQFMYHTP
jgi:hypothetical protein